jgi:hypothetical protein
METSFYCPRPRTFYSKEKEAELRKIFRALIFFIEMGFDNSVKSIISDLNTEGYHFFIHHSPPKRGGLNDYVYRTLRVNFWLGLGNERDDLTLAKPLSKWWTEYIMLVRDVNEFNWDPSNVWEHDSTCSISDLLEVVGLEVDRVSFFRDEWC